MLSISVAYDNDTKLLSASDEIRRDEVIGGTDGDANTTCITFTFSNMPDTYTVKCAVGVNITDDGKTYYSPEYALTNNAVVLPSAVMSAPCNGVIPIQLHFTSGTEEWYSLNRVKLRILPAIDGIYLTPVDPEPTPTPTGVYVSDMSYDDDITLTLTKSDTSQEQIQLTALNLRLQVPTSYDSVDAQTASGTLRLTPSTSTHSAVLTLATKEYVDSKASTTYEVVFSTASDTWAHTIASDKNAVANIQTFVAMNGTWYEVFGDIQQVGRNITIKFNSAVSGKMVIS